MLKANHTHLHCRSHTVPVRGVTYCCKLTHGRAAFEVRVLGIGHNVPGLHSLPDILADLIRGTRFSGGRGTNG